MKNNIAFFSVLGLIFATLGTIWYLNQQSLEPGVIVGKLEVSELTIEEQKELPFLFDRTYYVAVRKEDGSIVHAIKVASDEKSTGAKVHITKFMNNGKYVVN